MAQYRLRAELSDGFQVNLDERFENEQRALNAADRYIGDYSDPCGLGVYCRSVAVIDCDLESASAEEREVLQEAWANGCDLSLARLRAQGAAVEAFNAREA